MKLLKLSCIGLLACITAPMYSSAQTPTQADKSAYNPLETFDPSFYTFAGNEYRSANGAPGPKYWQNSASYTIHATLNEPDTTISGNVSIDYTNNSPDTLNYLWLQIDQNIFDQSSRGVATTVIGGDRFDVKGYTKGGEHIQSVSVVYKGKTYKIDPVITDTRLQVRLPFGVHPNGDKITVKVNYWFSIPEYGADRMGRLYTKNGVVYQLAQWYPRMCVYDDMRGWGTLPYLGQGEFYCEYGNYDYYITAPADMIVAGSGDLQNPQEVLTATEMNRLAKARKSDSAIQIIKEDEVGAASTRPKTSGNLTWHFKMLNSRDVSWAASKAFRWDATRINFPSGRKGISMAVYPVESQGYDAYGRAADYLKRSIEIYSKDYFEYPWNSAVVVAGVALGMEYPGIVFTSYKIKTRSLWGDVTHEIGHNWFPMIVGSNERRFMWMDEGFNTFINQFSSFEYNNGEYGNKHYPSISPRAGRMLSYEKDPLMTPPEAMGFRDVGLYYNKTSMALDILRNDILGADRFDYAFRTYIKNWAFKHPWPYDFFHTMDNAAGEDLSWFWKEWFYTTWTLDQAVTGVKYVDDKPENGALITISNLGKMVLPVTLDIKQQNGDSSTVKLPVEIWQRGGDWTFKYNSTSPIESVVIDPKVHYPDTNRDNNTWKAQ
ncbi:peptidase M1 [Arachidicoccus ginsenosidimutans]|uniref:M1 family metallopeptidase n=1 Tax=Arachidicoccus sp. BS20 TaxID=1850526 RepID=UPI0007F1699C|nr:M1 family metallopeptidase [Arachidicoccus sp. BS20]ANI90018.1 peptidase M1 [Arachidicoccus sp. BS20]